MRPYEVLEGIGSFSKVLEVDMASQESTTKDVKMLHLWVLIALYASLCVLMSPNESL